jgi:hypothetical protein
MKSATKATDLRASHEVAAKGDNRDRILLYGRWSRVMRVADVLEQDRVEWRACKLVHWVGHARASGFDWDVRVFLEVDASMLLRWVIEVAVELLLHARAARAGDVLAILPDTKAVGNALAAAASAASTAGCTAIAAAAAAKAAGATCAEAAAAAATGTETAAAAVAAAAAAAASAVASPAAGRRASVVPSAPASGASAHQQRPGRR